MLPVPGDAEKVGGVDPPTFTARTLRTLSATRPGRD